MSHIGFAERMIIEAGIARHESLASIAKQINVQQRAVSEEIRKNRTLIPAARFNGKDCKFADECRRRYICGNTNCRDYCVMCKKMDCCSVCAAYSSLSCELIKRPPYVCNTCNIRRLCKSDRAQYDAKQAHALATRRFSDARSKPQTQGDDLKALDELISPLVRKGQPLAHICSQHKEDLPISERTLYRYIESGLLDVGNIDLRRKVGYRPRKKKKKEPTEAAKNYEFRKNRTFADFTAYLEKHPEVEYVEMDTVVGGRGKGKRMLTMLFVKHNLMLIFLMLDGKADSVVDIFDWLTSALGIKAFRKLFPVILTDNGCEFKRSRELEYTVEGSHRTRIFYCDPQASWQKPHIEKNHEYIRYVIPKGKSMDAYTQDDFTLLASHINSTKRAMFDGRSPIEMVTSDELQDLLDIVGIKAIPADEVELKPKLLKRPI